MFSVPIHGFYRIPDIHLLSAMPTGSRPSAAWLIVSRKSKNMPDYFEDFSERKDYITDILPDHKRLKMSRRLRKFLVLAGFFSVVLMAGALYFSSRRPGAGTDSPKKGLSAAEQPYAASLLVSSAREELFFPEGGLSSVFNASAAQPVNAGRPLFSEEEVLACSTQGSFAWYSPLDPLGRCGPACALLDRSMMPEAPRESIGMVRPSGWHTVKYSFIDGMFLYNRCHLIGYQLTGENANPLNLITGTRQLNVDPESGMLPFENRAASCVRLTGLHVIYRVIPWFYEEEPLARGVTIEAMSLEDGGAALSFAVYLPNTQAGVSIDYATGESCLLSEESAG